MVAFAGVTYCCFCSFESVLYDLDFSLLFHLGLKLLEGTLVDVADEESGRRVHF